jgi:hypothetical protein
MKKDENSQPDHTIPEGQESPEDMGAFLRATLTRTEGEKSQLQVQLRKQKACCQDLAQLAGMALGPQVTVCVGRVTRYYRCP